MLDGIILLVGIIVALVAVALLLYIVQIYNGLVRLKKNIEKAWANIGVLLKQRHDELPKLIDTVKVYMKYEQDLLTKITEARTKVYEAKGPKAEGEADGELHGLLGNLFAVAENYPDLKANKSFMQLQERISSIEEQIADRREFYNDSVNTYNIRINQIPYNIIAGMLHYTDAELFEVAEADKKDVNIEEAFKKK